MSEWRCIRALSSACCVSSLSGEFKVGLSAELLNADDLVLVAETIQGIAARKIRK